MYGPLELESLVEQRHEGALQALVNSSPRFGWAAGANGSWTSVLSLLRGTGLS
jgi:hypothetical protein